MLVIFPTRSIKLGRGFIAATSLALLVFINSGCAQLRNSAHGFFSFSPDTSVVATWVASPDLLFLYLVAAACATFPNSEIHSVPPNMAFGFGIV